MKKEVIVVSYCPDSLEMLQRRVGGILKGIASVKKLLSEEVPEDGAGTMYVCLARGMNYDVLTQRFKNEGKIIIGAELTLLPTAIRTLRTISEDKILGVVSDHQKCANYFLSEIISSVSTSHRYITGTFSDVRQMPADVLVIPEELEQTSKSLGIPKLKETVYLPRAISQHSAAEIIDHALKIFN